MLRRRSPPPPPSLPPEEAERLGRVSSDPSFITGNGFAARCRFVLNYGGPETNAGGEEGWCFCRTDALEWFFEHAAPRDPYVLVTHNSDYPIDERFASRLRGRRLKAWFAANAELRHPRLHPIPLGIANPAWPHGDPEPLREAQRVTEKRDLFDVSFSLETNEAERRRALELSGLELTPPLPYPQHLLRVAAASFALAPRGNGIDTHRVWEALYLRTVPVVTRSALTDAHPDLPLVVLDDWSEFASIDFGPDLYEGLMRDWDPDVLSMDAYFGRLERIAAHA